MTKRDFQCREYAAEAGDLVTRLYDRAYSFKAPDRLVEEAAAEIARLRSSMAEQRFCKPKVAGSSPAAGCCANATHAAEQGFVSLRDHFAAAALTGLLSHSIAPEQAMSQYVRIAAAYADAMLREREKTNHDAAPAAIASPSESSVPLGNGGGCGGTDKPVTLPAVGAGDIPCSRTRLSEAEIDALEYVVVEGRIASMDDYGILRSLLVRLRSEWGNA